MELVVNMEPVAIYFLGTAGSGKTSLTHAFQRWMQQKGLDCIAVNLDPGADKLPFTADYDIREWLDLRKVMEEYNLGPNGAQIACADLLALKANEIHEILDSFRAPYILIDTPGQLELFSFRKSSRVVVEALSGERSALAFLLDPSVAKVPSGYVSQLMLAATVQFRFSLPMMNVLSKTDMLDEKELETIAGWAEDPHRLQAAMEDEMRTPQMVFNMEMFRALESLGTFRNFIPASAETGTGIEDIYTGIQNHFHGGEDLSKD